MEVENTNTLKFLKQQIDKVDNVLFDFDGTLYIQDIENIHKKIVASLDDMVMEKVLEKCSDEACKDDANNMQNFLMELKVEGVNIPEDLPKLKAQQQQRKEMLANADADIIKHPLEENDYTKLRQVVVAAFTKNASPNQYMTSLLKYGYSMQDIYDAYGTCIENNAHNFYKFIQPNEPIIECFCYAMEVGKRVQIWTDNSQEAVQIGLEILKRQSPQLKDTLSKYTLPICGMFYRNNKNQLCINQKTYPNAYEIFNHSLTPEKSLMFDDNPKVITNLQKQNFNTVFVNKIEKKSTIDNVTLALELYDSPLRQFTNGTSFDTKDPAITPKTVDMSESAKDDCSKLHHYTCKVPRMEIAPKTGGIKRPKIRQEAPGKDINGSSTSIITPPVKKQKTA